MTSSASSSAMFRPSREDLTRLFDKHPTSSVVKIPVFREIPSDLLTPVSAYLKLRQNSPYSFLLESVAGGEKLGRFSFLGSNPSKVNITGDGQALHGDPLKFLEKELGPVVYEPVSGLPSFTGGAIGFITYDCVKYFEPRTERPLKDVLQLPESVMMFCDNLVIFDHLHHVIKVVAHITRTEVSSSSQGVGNDWLDREYDRAISSISAIVEVLNQEHVPLPPNHTSPSPILGQTPESNVGQNGYEQFVRNLKSYIEQGEIIQAVPSQRFALPTSVHPFNVYRRLRSINPSPYMFYLDLDSFQIVGASPEMLTKVENRVVYTHPIAGTRKRGATPEEDQRLADELLADEKERAEHVMLVDLGRNDLNRVCEPLSVKVDSLMHIERYSHVMHIVTNVSGVLRPEKSAYDAFRSIFPAGTVSGAPKVRAMEIIAEQEKERRGVYAGAVGYFGYNDTLDTCIAIRTMVFKNQVAYLQAGAGIVYDSVPTSEYEETVSKLRSNMQAVLKAEELAAGSSSSLSNVQSTRHV